MKRHPYRGEPGSDRGYYLVNAATGEPVAGWEGGRGTLDLAGVEKVLGYRREDRKRA